MYQWVRKTLEWVNSEGHRGQVHAKDLQNFVETIHPWRHSGDWQSVTRLLKDQTREEMRKAFVPVGQYWIYNPSVDNIKTWMRQTLSRLEPEMERMVETAELPRYIKSPMIQEYRERIIHIRDMAQSLIDKMDAEA